jgi:peroxiredoxin
MQPQFKHVLQRFGLAAVGLAVLLGGWFAFVRSTAPAPEAAHNHASSEDHKECAAKIVGKPLPSFSITDADGHAVNVAQRSTQSPLILIRFMGNTCSHCMEQLVALNRHAAALKSSGVRVVALSEDGAEDNRATMKKYGFDASVFTFATDAAGLAAKDLGALYTEKDGSETELHVALVVKRGTVVFANYDTKPFMNVDELLRQAGSGIQPVAAQ